MIPINDISENRPRKGPSPINPTILPRSGVPEIKKVNAEEKYRRRRK